MKSFTYSFPIFVPPPPHPHLPSAFIGLTVLDRTPVQCQVEKARADTPHLIPSLKKRLVFHHPVAC